jgi:FixJ family two-component response regulator
LQHKLPEASRYFALDIRVPGMRGLNLRTHLGKANIHVPIIMMTAHGCIPMSVRAIMTGLFDFLAKPFYDQECSLLSRGGSNETEGT